MNNDINKKYVLFSPIGNHDPFGKTNNEITDGPLLHIARHYKPEIVILFMTKEMYEKELNDNRYTKNLNCYLPDSKVEILKDGFNISNAHLFDEFITPYSGIFQKIKEKYPEHEIIFNVSSGTPQMISSLILEAQTTNIKTTAVQVVTPQNKANIKDTYQSDDIEYVINETENNNNRCKEPEFKSFKKMRLKSQLEILIKNYEYQSALNLIEQEKENLFSEEVIDLIKHLAFRSKFDKQSTQYAKQYKLDQGNFEYFYTIKLKQKKGELMDMVLKITPFVNTLLRNQVEDYYYKIYKTEFNELITIEKKNKKQTENLNRETIEMLRPEILAFLDEKFDCYNSGFIKNVTLKYIFDYLITKLEYSTEKDKNNILQLSKKFNRLMDLEQDIRNKAAHEMISIDEKQLKESFNGSSKDVIKDLERILILTNNFPQGRFIYDEMNEKLLKIL